MTEEEVNREAFRLVGLLQETKDKPPTNRKTKKMGSLDDLAVVSDLKFVEGPIYKYGLNPDHSTNKIIISLNGLDYGFSDVVYPEFYELVSEISEQPSFESTVSNDFIESRTILWIANVYREKRATQSLVNYLKSEIEAVDENLTLYYPVTNLHISKPFKIGKVEITYFSKEYFDELWANNTKKDRTEEEFNKLYRKYQGRVFASYTIKAEPKKAQEIAFQECLLAVDVLKLFSPTVFYPDKKCYVGIEGNLNFNFQSDFISIPVNEKDGWKISFTAKNDPFIIDDKFIDNIGKAGLNLISNFILAKNSNDLSNLIIQAITLTSNAISNFDLHFRIAQLITVIESLLLEEDRRYDMVKLSKQRVSILFKDKKVIGDYDINELLTKMYQVRHKIINKAIRLPINITDLKNFQILVVELIKVLILAHRNVADKQSLIKELDG